MDIKSRFVIAAETTGQAAIDNLSRGVGKVSRGVDSIAASARAAGPVLAGFATAGVVAFAAAAKSSLDLAGAIVDLSDRTGLSVEAVQELRFAFGKAGISADEFENAMQKFAVTLGKAANGSKAQAEFFLSLGINARAATASTEGFERALLVFADRVRDADSVQQGAALASEAFGKGVGSKLTPALREGSEGLNELRQQARDAGAVLSETAARDAEEFGDKLEALSTIVKTQVAQAIIDLAPVIIDLGSAFAVAARNVGAFFDTLSDGSLENLAGKMGAIESEIADLRSPNFLADRSIEARNERLEDEIVLLQRLANVRKQHNALIRPPGRVTSETPRLFNVDGIDIDPVGPTAKPARAVDPSRAAQEAAEAFADSAEAAAIRGEVAFEEMVNSWVRDGNAAAKEIADTFEGLNDSATADVQADIEANLEVAFESLDELQARAAAAADFAGAAIEDGIFALFEDGADGMVDAFGRALQQIALDIARSQIREALTELFSGISDGSSGGGGGFLDAIIGAIGGASGGGGAALSKTGGASAIKGFATGGSFVVPGSSEGDKIIPIFRVNRGERIDITPQNGGNAGGGVNIVNNINAPGADPASESRIREQIRSSEQRTIAQVRDLVQRRRL